MTDSRILLRCHKYWRPKPRRWTIQPLTRYRWQNKESDGRRYQECECSVVSHNSSRSNYKLPIRTAAEINDPDYDIWIALASVLLELLTFSKHRQLELLTRPTMVTRMECCISHSGQPRRPSFIIPSEMLEDLRGYGFSWNKTAKLLGVSRWTIHRRVISMGITNLGDFTLISDDELDQLISDYINRLGATSGLTYI